MRVCIVLDSKHRREYHLKELRKLFEEGDFEVPLVLIDESEDVSQEVTVDSGILDQMREFLRKIIHREFIVFVELEQKVAESLFPSKTVTDERRDLERRKDVFEEIDELEESDVVYFEPDQVGKHTYEFPDNITRRVTEEVDAVVLLGFSKILRGRIITEPEHGVLSFHGADIRKYRGRPGAFFQFINREEGDRSHPPATHRRS